MATIMRSFSLFRELSYNKTNEAPLVIHPTEASIHEHSNNIIYRLNQRREEMITEFREREREWKRDGPQQLIDSKADLQSRMKENLLHSMREKILEDIDTKMAQVQVVKKKTEVVFECDTRQLEQTICVREREREKERAPDYPALLQSSVSVGKEGRAEGKLFLPRGVAVDENSKLIYVANAGSGKNTGREEGTGVKEFNSPRHLTVTTDKSVLVADCYNDRIVEMDTDLKHKRYIKHQTMICPADIKVNNNKLYVLRTQDSPCLHVLSLTGEKISSLITCDLEGNAQVRKCYSFCFDKKPNILISDFKAKNIKVFSREALLHTLGDTRDRDNTIEPEGIILTDNNTIICTSFNTNFGLQIF